MKGDEREKKANATKRNNNVASNVQKRKGARTDESDMSRIRVGYESDMSRIRVGYEKETKIKWGGWRHPKQRQKKDKGRT